MKLRKNDSGKAMTQYRLKRSAKQIVVSVVRYAFLLALGYIIISQLLYMLSYALRSPSEVNDPSVVWIPRNFTLGNFSVASEALDFLKAFGATLGIQILSALIEVITCAIPAYGLARFRFRGRNVMFFIVILMILVPPQMTAVSMSLNYAHFDVFGILGAIGSIIGKDIRPNLLNTGFVFWLPSLFGVGLRSGLFIFIYRQFFKGLPKELEEAAAIDGASPFMTFWRVVVPSSGVAFLTVTIFSVVWHWNEYYQSVLFLTDNYPLSVALSKLDSSIFGMSGYGSGSLSYTMAACVLYILPLFIMYIILQRKFISSIDRVGIVG